MQRCDDRGDLNLGVGRARRDGGSDFERCRAVTVGAAVVLGEDEGVWGEVLIAPRHLVEHRLVEFAVCPTRWECSEVESDTQSAGGHPSPRRTSTGRHGELLVTDGSPAMSSLAFGSS